MEKPVASDAIGVKRVLAAVEESKKKNLMVGIGLQRRHEPQYMETIKRLHDGAIGDIIALRVYWNGGGIWHKGRDEAQALMPAGKQVTEMAYQCNNWYHFNWLSGDQICEQHIHNLDVGCWVKGAYPVECNGMGGRAQRMDGDPTKSQIFDHTFCEYTFAMARRCSAKDATWRMLGKSVDEFAHGSKGTAIRPGSIEGPNPWNFSGKRLDGHQQEQHDLIEALMRGEIYNEGEYGAKSTFTAILGREACYSGKVVKWDELLEKGRELAAGIDNYTLDSQSADDAGRQWCLPASGSRQVQPLCANELLDLANDAPPTLGSCREPYEQFGVYRSTKVGSLRSPAEPAAATVEELDQFGFDRPLLQAPRGGDEVSLGGASPEIRSMTICGGSVRESRPAVRDIRPIPAGGLDRLRT